MTKTETAVADGLEVAELGRKIVAGTAEVSSYMAWWLALVAEFDRREGWVAEGATSCSHWLSWRCGIDGRTARAHVRVATQLEGLPRLGGAFAEGRLSYSKVRAVCRVTNVDNEELLVELASNLTATQLERSVAAYAKTHGQPLSLDDDAERRSRCGVTTWVDAEGLHHTEIVSAPEDGAVIELGLDYGREQVFKDTKMPVRGREGRLDALLWVLRRGLANARRPGLVDDSRYLIVLHVREAQAFMTDDGLVDLGDGSVIHPRTLQRLGCDGLVQGMLEGLDGRPLDLGRKVRTATEKQKLAIKSMYQTCQWPGCEVSVERCQFHHLDWWTNGGRTDLHLLRPLCHRHHHLVHEGGFRLVVDVGGSLVAMAPASAAPIVNAPPLTTTAVDADRLVLTNRATGHVPVDDAIDCAAGRWGGEHLDRWALGAVVDAMVAARAGSPPAPN